MGLLFFFHRLVNHSHREPHIFMSTHITQNFFLFEFGLSFILIVLSVADTPTLDHKRKEDARFMEPVSKRRRDRACPRNILDYCTATRGTIAECC